MAIASPCCLCQRNEQSLHFRYPEPTAYLFVSEVAKHRATLSITGDWFPPDFPIFFSKIQKLTVERTGLNGPQLDHFPIRKFEQLEELCLKGAVDPLIKLVEVGCDHYINSLGLSPPENNPDSESQSTSESHGWRSRGMVSTNLTGTIRSPAPNYRKYEWNPTIMIPPSKDFVRFWENERRLVTTIKISELRKYAEAEVGELGNVVDEVIWSVGRNPRTFRTGH